MDRCRNVFKSVIENKKWCITIFALGIGILIFGLIMCVEVAREISIIEPLRPNSWRFGLRENRTERLREIHLFHWANVDEYLHHNATPHFVEIGPFKYKETQKLENVTWSQDRVEYSRVRFWHFIPEGSAPLNTPITSINIMLAILAYRNKNININIQFSRHEEYDCRYYGGRCTTPPTPEVRNFIEDFGDSRKFSTTKTAKERLFDGYEDTRLSESLGKFGYFASLNGTSDGFWSRSINDRILHWRSNKESFHGQKAYAAFDAHNQFLNSDSVLSEFLPEICWEAKLKPYIHPFDSDSGIRTYGAGNGQEYLTLPKTFFGKCLMEQEPFWPSLPHFAGQNLPNISGLSPETMDWPNAKVDLISGVTLESSITYQIGIEIQPLLINSYLNKIIPTTVPLFWVRDTMKVTDDVIAEIAYYHHQGLRKAVMILATSVGVLLTILGSIVMVFHIGRQKQMVKVDVIALED